MVKGFMEFESLVASGMSFQYNGLKERIDENWWIFIYSLRVLNISKVESWYVSNVILN